MPLTGATLQQPAKGSTGEAIFTGGRGQFAGTGRGRGQEGPAKLLTDFKGVLQTDRYAVYGALFAKSDQVTLAACMAHARRKFDEAFKYDPVRAKYAVAQIAKLYALEKEIRDSGGMEEQAICQLRLKVAALILEELKSGWIPNPVKYYPTVLSEKQFLLTQVMGSINGLSLPR